MDTLTEKQTDSVQNATLMSALLRTEKLPVAGEAVVLGYSDYSDSYYVDCPGE